MSVLEDPRRIGDDSTESVEPNSSVNVVFVGLDIHGKVASATVSAPQTAVEWIGRGLWWGGTSFNATAPVFFAMTQFVPGEWRYSFTMIGQAPRCVEASIGHAELSHSKRRYCIPHIPGAAPGLARRRFPRRRLVPTPDRTGLARDSCRR